MIIRINKGDHTNYILSHVKYTTRFSRIFFYSDYAGEVVLKTLVPSGGISSMGARLTWGFDFEVTTRRMANRNSI